MQAGSAYAIGMTHHSKEELIRRCFAAYKTADRSEIERLLADDFTFTSPYDDHIDRAEYFARCWPMAGSFEYHDLKLTLGHGDAYLVLYEGKSRKGAMFRNVELFHFAGDRVRSIEVFFGLPPGAVPATPPR